MFYEYFDDLPIGKGVRASGWISYENDYIDWYGDIYDWDVLFIDSLGYKSSISMEDLGIMLIETLNEIEERNIEFIPAGV